MGIIRGISLEAEDIVRMASLTNRQKVLRALRLVPDIGGSGDIVSGGKVQEVSIDGSALKVILFLPTDDREEKFRIEDQSRGQLEALEGVKDVTIVTRGAKTLEVAGKAGPRPEAARGRKQHAENPFDLQAPIPGVKRVIAVASAKGGVGKSTVCVNLALALQKRDAAVGLMDADIYGPSLHVLLGINSRPHAGKEKEISPIEKDGLKLISLGFLTDPGTPVIWRGPIVIGVVRKFLQDVEWGELDYLLVDLPPGTGDAQLTLVQTVPLDGAIIVTTPSKLALVDAEKGLKMFTQVGVPVLGIIENMSYFICPHCGERTDVFDSGGARRISEKLSAVFLGEIPLDGRVRESGDRGEPIVKSDGGSPIAKSFLKLADEILLKFCAGVG